ncbi:hypothetical protein [Streptomyces pacificus]|uniref:Uncharacterized protein n=1 Tax=Streptomyces pacificus TaxID=2705029 RepID=A0A6A0AX75_9ACTN|nr:hypothetical protein [Streptomyces pacificus]GFH36564.1 hypothetical protein SCWH03_27930 [Streptomyces pacificus]
MSEALVALAAAGGTAVVQAAGTDAWTQVRVRLARLVGRGGVEAERRTLSRLDRTAAELADADAEEIGALRAGHGRAWQARFEMLLSSLPDDEREVVAAELQELVAESQQERPGARNRFEISGGTFHSPVQIAEYIHGTTFNIGPASPSSEGARDRTHSPQEEEGDDGTDPGPAPAGPVR